MKRLKHRVLRSPIAFFIVCSALSAAERLLPTIDGDWWQVAGDPDLGAYTLPKQQPVDFGVW